MDTSTVPTKIRFYRINGCYEMLGMGSNLKNVLMFKYAYSEYD